MCRKRVCCLRLYNFSSCNNFSGTYQKTREPAGYRRLSVFIELSLLGDVTESAKPQAAHLVNNVKL